MFDRFSRSWSLMKASGEVLRQNKALMVFPFYSGIASILLIASFMFPLLLSGSFEQSDQRGLSDELMWVIGFLFYLSQYFVVFFFNSALIGAAMILLAGGDPGVADGMAIARSKFKQILGYAMFAATVGIVLRMIEERVGFIGSWIAGLLGVVFSVATFLTVPVLVSRDIGPLDAVSESAKLLKKTWGENIIGNAGMGVVFIVFYVLLALVAAVLFGFAASIHSAAAMLAVAVLLVVAIIVLALVQAALQGVYAAALYRYATAGKSDDSFSSNLLQEAFKPK